MKTVKQILEENKKNQKEILAESLDSFADAGLLEDARVSLIKRSIQKDPATMTVAERKSLVSFVETILEAKKRPAGHIPAEKDVPVVIILQRKAIRVFPDNQKIALYYSPALDKYVSIPYGPKNDALGIHLSEAKAYGKTDAALDAASFIPGPVGSAASLASAGRSVGRGDYVGAALDVAGALPVVGYGAKALKAARAAKKSKVLGAGAKTIQRGGTLKQAATSANRQRQALAKQKAAEKARQKAAKGSKKKKRGSGLGAAAAGAAGLAAGLGVGGASGSGDDASTPRRTDQSGYTIGKNIKPQVGGPGQRATVSGQEVEMQRRLFGIKESASNFQIIKHIVENNIKSHDISFDDKPITVSNRIAKKLVHVHESLNSKNKKKLESMLNEDATSFKKAINFAIRS